MKMESKIKASKNLNIVSEIDGYVLYEYHPTLLKPLLVEFEPLHLVRRFRFLLEYLYPGHYSVFYLSHQDNMVGYCVIVPGGRRLKCASKNDIVIGPYFIDPKERGKGYCKTMLKMILQTDSLRYEWAYDYILKTNKPSIAVTEHCGFSEFAELNVFGILRKQIITTPGDYVLYRYQKEL